MLRHQYEKVTNRDDSTQIVTATVLSTLSIALIVAVIGGVLPATLLPTPPSAVLDSIPHMNVLISGTAIGTIVSGWILARRGRIDAHRRAMLAATGLFGLFLCLYLYRLSILGSPTPFIGPEIVYRFVYIPVLVVHIALAICCVPLVYYVLLLGLTMPKERLSETLHPTVGRLAASLWIVSFGLGIVVYLLLHVLY